MKKTVKLIIFLIIAVSLIIPGCSKEEEDEDKGYSFEVITYKGEFEGYYKVDEDKAVFFESTVAEGNTNYHTFSQKIEPDSSVYISATAVDDSATSMQIHLYYDAKLVETNSFSQTTDSSGNKSIVNGTLQYTIGTTTE